MPRIPLPQLTCTVILILSFYCYPALATTEPDVTEGSQQTLQFDMESYTPDQSEWSKKQIAKYEKKKNTGGLPLAMLKIERLNLEAPVYLGTDRGHSRPGSRYNREYSVSW